MRAFVFSWLGGGNLNNGANAGLWYVNGNNGLGNANWNIGSRQSGAYGKLSQSRLVYRTPDVGRCGMPAQRSEIA